MAVKLRPRHIRRVIRFLKILAKYGLADEWASSGTGRRIRIFQFFFGKKQRVENAKYSRWERIRFAVEDMGTTAIKFAQILSTRPDLIPLDLIKEFEKLQNDVPPFSVEKVREIIRKEWGVPLEDYFDEFDEVPLAAASIAQVHKGRLKTGQEVIIKVQRPEISDFIHLDIEILHLGAREYMKMRGETSAVDMEDVVKNFEVNFLRELSFLNEAAWQARYADYVKDDPDIIVPGLYKELCTEKILVMDFVKGVKVTDLQDYEAINCDPKVIAQKGMESVFKQMFEHGFFHGDPHPGNIFVLPGNRICLIDFGMMGTVIKSDLYSFADILLGIRYENANKVLFGIKNLMVQKRIPNERKLLIEIDDMMYLFNRQKPEEVKLEFFFNRLRDIVREQKIQMPADFFVLSKAMVTIEGVGRRIYPDMDILSELEPHLKGVFRDRYSPGKVWERIMMNAGEIMSVLENMPGDTRDIVQNVKEITGKYDSVEKELTRFSHSMKRTSAQIELAIVLGIWLICSTLLMAAKFPPLVGDSWSLFGLFGYFISFIAGYRLLKK
jgi:ubiquinone biosynthesis protein